METIYRVYCSKCNKNVKEKMSWRKYLYYVATDGKSKGYHDINSCFVNNNDRPDKCPFGHTNIKVLHRF